ncbi:hypothetical protein FA13DRAFT_1740553 [Coprinellus micaceus]|uniref:Acyltransferase 3 domain-containing protein n=1 Tax=Coprinellus micaceus TaxID=71717 RepID=A0A4Y7SLZ0_COPMI|nr:hypothetical protein FA13DRAFT_1740553 [Coprinellus micaceus]
MGYPLDLEDYDDSNGSADDYRTHFMDNLRTTLTVLLIVQHSIIETASSSYPYFDSTPLTVFVFMCKTLIVGLFFFISGYAASISRSTPAAYYGAGRSDASFVWRRSLRLLFPAFLYGIFGHLIIWMVLTKSWPSFFGGAGSVSTEDGYSTPQVWGFARFEGPVVHILFLWVLDMAYVFLRPAKKAVMAGIISTPRRSAPPPKSDSERSISGNRFNASRRKAARMVKIRSRKDWYRLSGIALALLSVWTFAVTASGKSEKSPLRFGFNVASYDAIVPAAPFQHILAYMAGIQLYKWQNYMLIPSPYIFPAFIASLFSSVSLLLLSMAISPTMREIVQLNTPWPVHPSFVDGGFNYHTLFFSVWNAVTFFALASTIVSLYAQWEWTRRDWGSVARHSYIPVWFHMIPIVFFVRLLAADGGWSPSRAEAKWAPGLAQESVVWRCFLVATGSTICSWFVGLAVAGCGWVLGC